MGAFLLSNPGLWLRRTAVRVGLIDKALVGAKFP
jgi:hypothetical protein